MVLTKLLHQQNVSTSPDVAWCRLVPLDPLVHHPAPRSRCSTRTLGQRSWSTLPLFWLLLILASILLCPSTSPSYTPSCSQTTASLSLERSWSAILVPQFTLFSLYPNPEPSRSITLVPLFPRS